MTLKQNFIKIIPLSIILCGLLTYSFMQADWTAPTADAPDNNTASPLNVSSSTQVKDGTLIGNIFGAVTEMRSDRYCDKVGANCTGLNGGGTTGGDEIIYLATPQRILSNTDFRSSSLINKNFSLGDNNFPANVSKVYIVLTGQDRPARSTPKTTNNDATYTPPVPVTFKVNMPFTNEGTPLDTPSGKVGCSQFSCSGTKGVLGHWVVVQNGQLKLSVLCGAGCGLATGEPDINVDIGGYECTGSCGTGVTMRQCSVAFSWNINGKTGSLTRQVPGSGNMAIGVYAHGDDNPSPTIPFSQQLDSNSWGSSMFDSSERGLVGFATPSDYTANKAAFDSWNAKSNAVILSLPLTTGSTLSIANEAVSEVAAGTARITATIGVCSN